jgi:hypothetical protein
VFHHSQLRSALLSWLCDPMVKHNWNNDWEPGIDRLLIQNQAIHDEIRHALVSLGIQLHSLSDASCNRANEVPWAMRYGLHVACPYHKDSSPRNQWSVLIGLRTQGEVLYVQSETRVEPHRFSVANGDILLFQGSLFFHWTEPAAASGRLVIAWHVTLAQTPIKRCS